ncbi:MAG TPA: hypothetical protein DCX60_06510 [Phycisphaerales bacterium]|nr:hypothetical protein [Phycisphaerales bacterium]
MSSPNTPSRDSALQAVPSGSSAEPAVRYISRPVRAAQTPDPLADLLRLGGLVISVLLIVLSVVAVIGLVGIRLGFEPHLGLPNRSLDWSDFLIYAFEMTRSLPEIVTHVGNQQILLPVLGFMLIGTPAALLVIARPRVPGGPALPPQVQGLALAGSLFSSLFYLGALVWLAGPWRAEVLGGLSSVFDGYGAWFDAFVIICGVDAFLVCAMVPWLIFSFRLPLFRELQFATRAISLVGSILILFGASITLGIHNGLMKPRPVEGSTNVLMGAVGDDLVILEMDSSGVRPSCIVVDADAVRFEETTSINRLMREDGP